MRNVKHLQIEILDRKLGSFLEPNRIAVPQKGWIHSIRTTLNMSRYKLAKRLKLTQGAIQKIEEREASGQITLNKLKKTGDALDMHFVYGFFPKDGSLNHLIEKKAREAAKKIVLRTHQNMQLENQSIQNEKIQKAIDELAKEIKREMGKSLWD